jgi:MFS family permease
LAATFALGLVGALQAPAWGALIPEIVAPENLAPAVGLNAVNYNLSRVIGPPLAGVLVAAAGPAIAFAVNAISFVPTALVMRPHAAGKPLAAAAFRAGFTRTLALARSSAAVQNVLVRNATFGICASVIFSLLPLLARVDLHASPAQFGLLYGALGCGSVTVAQVLGRVREALGVAGAIFAGTLLLGCCAVGLGLTTSLPLAFALLFVAGFGWLTVLSSLNTAIQFAVPPERRASGFALYLVTSQGVMAIGAFSWGAFAAAFGVGATFVAAGAAFLLLALVTRRVPVPWTGTQA